MKHTDPWGTWSIGIWIRRIFITVMFATTKPWNCFSLYQNTGMGSISLLQGIFPTQGSNPGLPHRRWILYQLRHREAQKYWSRSSIPPPADLPNPGIKPGSPALHADSLPTELSGKPLRLYTWGKRYGPLGHFWGLQQKVLLTMRKVLGINVWGTQKAIKAGARPWAHSPHFSSCWQHH